MMHTILQQAINDGMGMGRTVLLQRPMDLVKLPALSPDDKRAILAAWASDFYAFESKPALRQLTGTTPVSISCSLKKIILPYVDGCPKARIDGAETRLQRIAAQRAGR